MPALSLCLLGTFRVYVDGKPAANFETNKVRALLAYLAVEPGPHERLRLAGLFWPEWPEAAARTYLRQALLNLRQVLEPSSSGASFLLSNRHMIQLNPASDHWLDVAVLSAALAGVSRLPETNMSPDFLARLDQAISLYQGDFLDGFYIDGCPAFEQWQLLTSEALRRQVVTAIGCLIRWHAGHGDIARAQQYAWRSLELGPLLEETHGHVMRLLAQGGDRNAAPAHYATYRRQLAAELA
jgi:DNA-binding SARP family transcriptional activator